MAYQIFLQGGSPPSIFANSEGKPMACRNCFGSASAEPSETSKTLLLQLTSVA
ncbi:MAG: hypothetical protein NZ805_03510 [Armatimonadetes bacterium]|nr:hypothetical protein [Armatimonadota bacterium]MDW8028084.1 hypothetical protein [Armatimonadota bacterium]